MKPPNRIKIEYEKVKVAEFITGVIEDIEYDDKHRFTFQTQEKIMPGVRFVFNLDSYNFKHYSRWMKFMYAEKSNLYKKYMIKLVDGATPDMDFDIGHLKGMKVKTIWSEEGDFQNIESIFPLEKKISYTEDLAVGSEEVSPVSETTGEEPITNTPDWAKEILEEDA